MRSGWYPKNKGKVRGWPRRLRHVEAFRQRHLALDERALAGEGRGWVKLWIDPWYRLVRRQPPAWLRRRMLAALLDIHRAWHERLVEHERETGEPFDCMVWLFHPHFIHSQVVFAVGEWRGFYRDTFPPAQDDAPSRTPALYDDLAYRLGALDWTPGYEVGYTSEADFIEDPEWAARFERRHRGYMVGTYEVHGERYLSYRIGRVWVGRLPGSTPAG